MTQLIETEPRYECITDDTVPCNNILIHPGMPATDEELLAFAFSNEFPRSPQSLCQRAVSC
jgi:hypothetical protein